MDDDPHVLNNFINCCTCAREAAMDFSNVAPLLFTDDTPVFMELIMLIIPSRTPPFPVADDEVLPAELVLAPFDVVVVVPVVVVAAVGTVLLVVDDSLLLVIGICDTGGIGAGCDKALPNAGIGADGIGAVGCGSGICCCCCICCHC